MAQFTTGEVAKLCGITVRTVQYYDSKGILKPSGITDGGRRLYSEEDVAHMRTVCFLKELGFSLKDISKLLEESNAESTIRLLLDARSSELSQEALLCKERLDNLKGLRRSLSQMENTTPDSIGAIAAAMRGKNALRRIHIWMVVVGIIMDVLWIGGLIYGIVSGNWVPFIVGLAAAIVLGVLISRSYYKGTAYICPEDHTVFRAPFRKEFFAAHTPRTRKLTCPVCGFRGFCLETAAPEDAPTPMGKDLVWRDGVSVLD